MIDFEDDPVVVKAWLEANKLDFDQTDRHYTGILLKYLTIALEGFWAQSWLEAHMEKKMCNVCALATVRRLSDKITDQEFIDQCCILAKDKIQKVLATLDLSRNELPKFLDQLESDYNELKEE